MHMRQEDDTPSTWKEYIWACSQFLLVFYAASFLMGLLFLHRTDFQSMVLYGAVFFYFVLNIWMAVRTLKKLSITAILIASPTVPLCMMILVVSLLPILQAIDHREKPQIHTAHPE